ncbi:sensor kinase/phosphatase LuxQ (Partial), partial [Seminavis robusta]
VVFRGQPAHPGHLSTDPKFHSRQRSIELRVASSETAPAPAPTSSSYVLTLYPNREFCDTYKTKNPQVSSIGAVLIVVAMSILFWLYDYFVRKEFNSKQQLLEAKRYFMRFVSHEVRTPLNAVCLGLALLKEELDDANAAQEPPCNNFSSSTSASLSSSISSSSSTPDVESFSGLVNDICDSAESAVQVLNDLLQYDKIQMGKFTMENTVISIVDLVQDISKEFRLSARKKNIAVTLDTSPMMTMRETTSPDSKRRCDEEMGPFHSPQDFKVVGDKIRITQILRNLVSNAVKFVPEQGHITLRLSWVPNSNTTSRSPRGNKGCDASWHERYATLLQHRGDNAEPRNKNDSYTLKSGQEVSYERQGMLHLDVIDTGAGMTPSQLKKLFQDGAQFNVNELQAGQGSGLGLFLSKSMAQQHGGELSAASQGLGKGTTFTFTLPLYFIETESSRDTISKSIPSPGSTLWKGASTTDRCSESDEGLDSRPTIRMNGRLTPEPHNEHARIPMSTLSTDPVVDQSHQNCSTLPSCQPTPTKTLPVLPAAVPNAAKLSRQPQLRILVVDDVPSNRKLLARMARNRKHNVDEAYDGQHAVEKVMESFASDQEEGAANPYQVILMDFEMPRLNGPDATRRIRELEGCQDIFIVGVTGNVLAEDVAHFLDSGADHVLPKPVKFPALEALWKDKFPAAGAADNNEFAKVPTSTSSTDPVVDQRDKNCSTLPPPQPTPTKTLPVLPTAVPSAAQLALQPQLRILVVDDVPSNRKLLARMARKRKHNVDEAYDGQNAVEKVMECFAADQEKGAANPYQVILMDFEMPRLNGPDATRRIREIEGCQDMFIVGVTGNVLAEDVARFLDCGADHVLPKPVKFPALEALWKDKFPADGGAAGKHPNS